VQFAFRWARLVRRQRGVVAIERRAIGAHILNVLAHVAEDMRMVLWWQRADTHKSKCRAFDIRPLLRHADPLPDSQPDLKIQASAPGWYRGGCRGTFACSQRGCCLITSIPFLSVNRCSGLFAIGKVVQFAFRLARLVRRQGGVVAIERRAIGAYIVAHVAKDTWMVLWWQRADTHKFLGADHDDRTPGSLWK
jgi:hypothetical protein